MVTSVDWIESQTHTNAMEEAVRNVGISIIASDIETDVILSCGKGQRIFAHRIMLAIASPVLRNLLQMQESNELATTIIFCDVNFELIKHIVQYIYNGYAILPTFIIKDFIAMCNLLEIKLNSFYDYNKSGNLCDKDLTENIVTDTIKNNDKKLEIDSVNKSIINIPLDLSARKINETTQNANFFDKKTCRDLDLNIQGALHTKNRSVPKLMPIKLTNNYSRMESSKKQIKSWTETTTTSNSYSLYERAKMRKRSSPNIEKSHNVSSESIHKNSLNYIRSDSNNNNNNLKNMRNNPDSEYYLTMNSYTSNYTLNFLNEYQNNYFPSIPNLVQCKERNYPIKNTIFSEEKPINLKNNESLNTMKDFQKFSDNFSSKYPIKCKFKSNIQKLLKTTTNASVPNVNSHIIEHPEDLTVKTVVNKRLQNSREDVQLMCNNIENEKTQENRIAEKAIICLETIETKQMKNDSAVLANSDLTGPSHTVGNHILPNSKSTNIEEELVLIPTATPSSQVSVTDVKQETELECGSCREKFSTRELLKEHAQRHVGEKPYFCDECGKTFSQLRNYKYHRSVHEGTKEFAAECPECGKVFNDRGYLSSHLKIHRNRKEYECAQCPKRFNQRVAYNMHARIHTGVKPHRCALCDKGFSRRMLLKQHMRVHTGERPYVCAVCGKSFADRSNMSLHARLHTGVKPYKCNICDKSFTKKHHLKTHMNYHSGAKPYPCPQCGLAFSQSSNMRTHYKKCSIGNNTATSPARSVVETSEIR